MKYPIIKIMKNQSEAAMFDKNEKDLSPLIHTKNKIKNASTYA